MISWSVEYFWGVLGSAWLSARVKESKFGTRRVRTGVAETVRKAVLAFCGMLARVVCVLQRTVVRAVLWFRGIFVVFWEKLLVVLSVVFALWNWRKKLLVESSGAHGCISEGTCVAHGCIYRDTYWWIILVILKRIIVVISRRTFVVFSRRKLSASRTVTSQRARTFGFCIFLYGISKFCDKF